MRAQVLAIAIGLLACDTPEKVETLTKRVDDLEAKLKAAQEKDEAHDALAKRVADLENRVAASEAQLSGVADAQKADAARLEALKLELEALKLETTKLATSATKTPEEGGLAEVGVPECDEYVQKYSRCVEEKMPEATRESMREALRSTVEAWQHAAANPRIRASLAEACKVALDAGKKATESMGCTW